MPTLFQHCYCLAESLPNACICLTFLRYTKLFLVKIKINHAHEKCVEHVWCIFWPKSPMNHREHWRYMYCATILKQSDSKIVSQYNPTCLSPREANISCLFCTTHTSSTLQHLLYTDYTPTPRPFSIHTQHSVPFHSAPQTTTFLAVP